MSLDGFRKRIDEVDLRILALLAERADVALEVGEAKRAAGAGSGAIEFYDPAREQQIFERLERAGAGKFPLSAIRAVFREVISACLSLEQSMCVAYLGPEGTFSHMAARSLFGLAGRYVEATTIDGVFDAVRTGDAAYGVVPVENTSEGSVPMTVDALIEGNLRIRQEVVLDVAHCLLSRLPGLTSVERVYSHPQALAQCRVWLAKNVPSAQLVQTLSTASAARDALADAQSAAIGSELAGQIYGLNILRERINDQLGNATRFLVLATTDAPRTGNDKTTIMFSVPEGRGSLRQVLSIFDDAGINLTRIESRPSRVKHWDYVFLADLDGFVDDASIATAIATLREKGGVVKVLGSYARAPKSRRAATE